MADKPNPRLEFWLDVRRYFPMLTGGDRVPRQGQDRDRVPMAGHWERA
jgi:hypothetical protein